MVEYLNGFFFGGRVKKFKYSQFFKRFFKDDIGMYQFLYVYVYLLEYKSFVLNIVLLGFYIIVIMESDCDVIYFQGYFGKREGFQLCFQYFVYSCLIKV